MHAAQGRTRVSISRSKGVTASCCHQYTAAMPLHNAIVQQHCSSLAIKLSVATEEPRVLGDCDVSDWLAATLQRTMPQAVL
jgi:hypothetical protein